MRLVTHSDDPGRAAEQLDSAARAPRVRTEVPTPPATSRLLAIAADIAAAHHMTLEEAQTALAGTGIERVPVDAKLADAYEAEVRDLLGLCPTLGCPGKIETLAEDLPIGGVYHDVLGCRHCEWYEERPSR